jgi:hypothetical protein
MCDDEEVLYEICLEVNGETTYLHAESFEEALEIAKNAEGDDVHFYQLSGGDDPCIYHKSDGFKDC